jgi:hypothetical protein
MSTTERWVSVAAAIAVALLGRSHRRHRQTATLASAFLMRRGVSGRCPLYTRLGVSSR